MQSSSMLDVWASDIRAIADRDLPWHELSGCRVLITGAGGFLGGYLTRFLLSLHRIGKVDRPVSVVAMVRNATSSRDRLSDIIDDPHFSMIEWDLNTIAVPDVGACHYAIHAASQASPRFYGTDPVGTLLPNALGTGALLQALRLQSPEMKGFLFVSSSEVYGSISGDAALSETDYGTIDPATLRACYAESKRLGETLCVAWTHQYQVPTFIVRPFHTYGPGLQANDGRVFADFVFNILRNEDIVMNSDGLARRAFCYASDAVAGFLTVLLKGTPATPYNVANPSGELSVWELAELLVGLRPELGLHVERRLPEQGNTYLASTFSRLVPDVSRLTSLGWVPEITPAQGFSRMLEAYKA